MVHGSAYIECGMSNFVNGCLRQALIINVTHHKAKTSTTMAGDTATDASDTPNNNDEQERQILLAMVFRNMLRRRRERQAEKEENEVVDRPAIRVLATEHVLSEQAICRFCLDNHTNSTLIAPCTCTGSAEYVHVSCLRQWQLSGGVGLGRCNVCTTPFSLRPPRLKQDLVRRGTLLIFKEEAPGSFFHQSVILMLSVNDTPIGIIINKAMQDPPPTHDQGVLTSINATFQKGGPVCGGRFGLTRYIVGHTGDRVLSGETTPYSSHLLIEDFSLIFNAESPAVLGIGEVRTVISAAASAAVGDAEEHPSSEDTSATKVILFAGYCKWSKRQLEGEILRGSWMLCRKEISSQDVFCNTNLWHELQEDSNRLMSRDQWFENAEDGLT